MSKHTIHAPHLNT